MNHSPLRPGTQSASSDPLSCRRTAWREVFRSAACHRGCCNPSLGEEKTTHTAFRNLTTFTWHNTRQKQYSKYYCWDHSCLLIHTGLSRIFKIKVPKAAGRTDEERCMEMDWEFPAPYTKERGVPGEPRGRKGRWVGPPTMPPTSC